MNFGFKFLKLLVGLEITIFCIFLRAQSLAANKSDIPLEHIHRARMLAAKGRWTEAEKEFRAAHQQDPNSTEAEVGHAEALVKIGQPFDAALELQEFLRDHPASVRAHEFYAVVTMDTSADFLVAEREFEECVKLAPRDPMAWKSLGDLYSANARPKDAITAYKKAVQLLPRDPLLLASMADAYAETGDDAKASEEFTKAVQIARTSTSSPEAHRKAAGVQYLYGRYLLNRNRPTESIVALTLALAYNPRSPVALYTRARAYEAAKEFKLAERDALLSFQLTPKDKEGALLLLDIYRKQHDPEKIQQYADLAQRLVDEQQTHLAFGREVRRLLGAAEDAVKKGQYSEAIPPYEELLSKVPTFYEAYFGLGMCYSQTSQLQKAEDAFRKYLSLQPVSGDGHAALGILLLEQGRGSEAIPELEQALQIDPTLDEARKAVANEYIHESKFNDAVRVLRAAGDSKDSQIKVLLATALMLKGDVPGAKREVRLALVLKPNDPEALNLQQKLSSMAELSK